MFDLARIASLGALLSLGKPIRLNTRPVLSSGRTRLKGHPSVVLSVVDYDPDSRRGRATWVNTSRSYPYNSVKRGWPRV